MQQQLLACDSENKANKEFYLPWFHRRTSLLLPRSLPQSHLLLSFSSRHCPLFTPPLSHCTTSLLLTLFLPPQVELALTSAFGLQRATLLPRHVPCHGHCGLTTVILASHFTQDPKRAHGTEGRNQASLFQSLCPLLRPGHLKKFLPSSLIDPSPSSFSLEFPFLILYSSSMTPNKPPSTPPHSHLMGPSVTPLHLQRGHVIFALPETEPP